MRYTTFPKAGLVEIPANHANRQARLRYAKQQRLKGRGRPYRHESDLKSDSITRGRMLIESFLMRGITR